MQAQPDSAFTLLSSIEMDRVHSGELRAHYALLYTQALEKTSRPITSDSIINIAVDYYSRRNIRIPIRKAYALFYQGCVRVQMNNITDAFQSFVQAQELASDLKDDYLLGLAMVNLAELYWQQYQFEQALELFRTAMSAFQRAEKDKHVCYTTIMMGRLFLSLDIDSSAYYCQVAREMAIMIQEIEYEYFAMTNMYNVYRKQRAFDQAKDLLLQSIQRYSKDVNKENEILLQMSQLFYQMNQLDSARYYVSLVMLDSLEVPKKPGALLLMKFIEEKSGNHQAALEYYTQYKTVSDEMMLQNQADDLKAAEARYRHEKLRSENYALENKVLSMIIALLAFAIITFFVVGEIVRQLKRRAMHSEDRLRKMSIIREDELLARSHSREQRLKQIVEHRFSVIKGLLDLSYIKDPQSNNFVERFRRTMALSGKPEETFFADLVPLMNDYYFGVIDWLKEHNQDLSDADIELICLLFYKFSPQELCVLYGLENIGAIYTRCSRVAKKLKIAKRDTIGRFLGRKIEELKAKKGV